MREFVVRARSAPVEPGRFLRSVGNGPHVEYLAQIMVSALLVSKGHRADTRVSLVMEGSRDYSRMVTIDGGPLGSLPGWHESALLGVLAEALTAARGLAKASRVEPMSGISVSTLSFEAAVRDSTAPVYLLDRKGTDIRAVELPEDARFVLTDHIPMPKKTISYLHRLGASSISLGPTVLHAAQCITLIHNELDRQGV
ncbi:MAG: tRNA (pseudouridine(54)-N(1))-methyltransferase TrmY [Proteobacteria bacterium]|nr:tRNA (pseudouridine(54)-N(1))-methyltransferase TrmY [Pseudomonadota bacterium]MDA1299218.1 tRNA (pseudouridine(54)-N(1))-methyltransferase TrmY [Pseudomonadota bacterium]